MQPKINRPQAGEKKIHSKNELELCYLRHQYLRRVDYNPSEAEMLPYMKIVKQVSRNTFYAYRNVFWVIGVELEDLINIGRVYLVEFLGLFKLDEAKNREKHEAFLVKYIKKQEEFPDDTDIMNKNKANFTMFMKQRLEDMVRICRQKSKNIKGMRVDEYTAFYGPNKPTVELFKLLDDNEAYGFKIIDNVAFKAVKKKAKASIGIPFEYEGIWYVAVPLEQRNLTILDLAGAGLDPNENFHNMDPEKILQFKEQNIRFDKKIKVFQDSPKEDQVKTIFNFIEENENNPIFEEEVVIAKKYLKDMGVEYAG